MRKNEKATPELKKAITTYGEAAAKGDADAMNKLGGYYEYAGCFKEAVAYYRRAAKKGNGQAQYNLSRCYLHNIYVRRDMSKAAYWMKRAAKSGDLRAIKCERLILAYEKTIEAGRQFELYRSNVEA